MTGAGDAFCVGGKIEAMVSESSDYLYELERVVGVDVQTLTDDARIGALYAQHGHGARSDGDGATRGCRGGKAVSTGTAEPANADCRRGARAGLIAEMVPTGDVLPRTDAVARNGIDGAPRAYGAAKRLLRSRVSRSLAEQVAEEARTISVAYDGEEASTLIGKFLAKRGRGR